MVSVHGQQAVRRFIRLKMTMRPLLKRLLGCTTFLALIRVDVCGHNLNGYNNDIRFRQQVKSIPGVWEHVSYKVHVRDARLHAHKLMTME